MKLILTDKLVERIRAHAGISYPKECCGALLGVEGEHGREVRELYPLANRNESSPQNRFAITPDDFRVAERVAHERGIELVGWYHSHPDHPARPSEFDREHAWPWYSYVIINVTRDAPGEMTSWRLADDRSEFQSEVIAVAFRAAQPRRAALPEQEERTAS